MRAYALVKEHFALLRSIVHDHEGALVKTIGDAIMATFAEPLPALRAALDMRREIVRVGDDEDLLLKLGIHSGPCIAVDSNDRLDYFGQTVNIAARVQGIADASEVVLTDPVYHAPGAADAIRQQGLGLAHEQASLKGVGGLVPVYRVH